MVVAYERGATLHALATEFGVHTHTISAHLEHRGIRRRYRLLDEHVDELVGLYESGWSLARIGKQFEVHPSTVLKALRAEDVAIRPVGTNQWRLRA